MISSIFLNSCQDKNNQPIEMRIPMAIRESGEILYAFRSADSDILLHSNASRPHPGQCDPRRMLGMYCEKIFHIFSIFIWWVRSLLEGDYITCPFLQTHCTDWALSHWHQIGRNSSEVCVQWQSEWGRITCTIETLQIQINSQWKIPFWQNFFKTQNILVRIFGKKIAYKYKK
jgi:hypothetical protein